jgi:Flp pilus assembly protein TadG
MKTLRHIHRQRGATAVEFALIAVLFATLLLSIIGFGHWMYTLEMATDATRTGARIAVVCDLDDTKIRQAIQSRVPQLSLANADISIQYFPAGCDKANCQGVTVALNGAGYASWIPALSGIWTMPSLATTLPRESMESVNAAGEINPVCI